MSIYAGSCRIPDEIRRIGAVLGVLSCRMTKGGLPLVLLTRKMKEACDDLDLCRMAGARRRLMRWINLPPVWLLSCVILAWLQAGRFSYGLSFGGAWADFLGGLLVGGGLVLAVLAVFEMRRQRTTVVPHKTPSGLVQSGIFSRSRNPIYLGDVLILTGLILRFDAVLSLPLIPVFVWILEKRFILPEEDRMRRSFRMEFARYEQKVRRWV